MYFSKVLNIFSLAATAMATTGTATVNVQPTTDHANHLAVSYDTGYDDGSRSLAVTACSDGPNGLMTKHPSWTKQSDVARFPYIGGVEAVAGWNSPSVREALSLS
jgi:hypothetical protein